MWCGLTPPRTQDVSPESETSPKGHFVQGGAALELNVFLGHESVREAQEQSGMDGLLELPYDCAIECYISLNCIAL